MAGNVTGIDRVENGKIYVKVNTGDTDIVQPIENVAFENGTTEVAYFDPAKSDAVSWSGNIEAAETVSLEKMFAFSSGHGIIY